MKFSYQPGLLQSLLRRGEHAALVACAILGGALVFYATGLHGIALSNDSAFYLSAARNVLNGSGVRDYGGSVLVILAPFYPFVLALVSWLGRTDPQQIAPAVNAFLYGGIVYFGGRIAFRIIETRWLGWAVTIVLVVSSNLAFISLYAWSETLYIFLTVLALGFAYNYLENHTRRTLVCLAGAIGLAWLTRYAGTAMLVWGVSITLVLNPAERKSKMRDTVLLVGLMCVLPGLWAMRNYVDSGTLFGTRPSSIFTLGENLKYTLVTIGRWFLPVRFAGNTLLLLGIGIVAALASVVAWRVNAVPLTRFVRVQAPVLSLALCYGVFLVVSAAVTAMDQIGDRLLSPLFVPVMLVAAGWLDAIARSVSVRLSRRVVWGALLLLVGLWLVYTGSAKYSFTTRLRTEGSGYTDSRWRNSPMLAYVRARRYPQDCVLATNNDTGVYLLTGEVMANLPIQKRHNSPDLGADIQSLRGKWPVHSKTCVIWFELPLKYYFPPQELGRIAVMEEIATFADGAAYVATRK